MVFSTVGITFHGILRVMKVECSNMIVIFRAFVAQWAKAFTAEGRYEYFLHVRASPVGVFL